MKRSASIAVLIVVMAGARALADTGVIIPSNRQQPDPSILSLAEMTLDIHIDDGDARALFREVFTNHTPNTLEGEYIFNLPDSALVSDFAVWDGVVRIPGVILERKRAGEVYAEARAQAIDPGLLQMGERTAAEARRGAPFSARIVPIPPYGTKRIELEYHQRIPVENLESVFAIPLRPDAYQAQPAGHLSIHLELDSSHPLEGFEVTSRSYPVHFDENDAHQVKASFEGSQVQLAEDFSLQYKLEASAANLQVVTHRAAKPAPPSPADEAPPAPRPRPGFFEASALLTPGIQSGADPKAGAPDTTPRLFAFLFDTSLSMQWEKLDCSFQALETILHSLRPSDRFALILFNTALSRLAENPVAADPVEIDKALSFVRSSYLRGGTNLQQALRAGLAAFAGSSRAGGNYLVLLSDVEATRGPISNAKLAAWYQAEWRKLPAETRPRTYIFGVGDDTNQPLLKMLAQEDGLGEWVRSTEPLDFKLKSFVSKIGRRPVGNLGLTLDPATDFDLVYLLDPSPFSGSMASWVGQYRKPVAAARFTVQGSNASRPFELHATVPLPAVEPAHEELPRLWAKARVDALLAKIERDGEDQATVDEIIRLARQYKFVTPYTSFLAAPRALLRPRVIRPGDPVLRVKTDPAIISVTALFPFGLIKPLRYLPDEDIWQTRFLAPSDMADGAYRVRLILRDREGRVYREAKSFVILSQPPVVRLHLAGNRFRRGEPLKLSVAASQWTRTVVARLPGAAPVELHWDPRVGANTGEIDLPSDLPAGVYRLNVIAEDVAHNIGSREVTIEVTP